MKIKVYTNQVFGGWSPRDIETGIGGSEEKLVEWATAIAKNHDVTIYMNGEHCDYGGAKYRPHKEFIPWQPHDVFISFKAAQVIDQSINADKIIHWTTEVEPRWPTSRIRTVDLIITISEYHKSRMGDKGDKIQPDYLWADLAKLDVAKVDKEKGSMLYSSSYDRGLEELLMRWEIVKEELGVKKLYITYGWEFLDRVIAQDPNRAKWKERMVGLMQQDGIEHLGRLSEAEMAKMYWKAEYWVLPLSNPDSELFCMNAIKAQYCEAIPLVRRIGALQETVNHFIDWDELLGQKVGQSDFDEHAIVDNTFHAKQFSLDKAIERWETLIGLD